MNTVKIPHLVLALLFLGISGSWLLTTAGLLELDHLPYVAPAVLVVAGVLGLVAMVLGARRRDPASGRLETRDERVEPDEQDLGSGYEPTAPLAVSTDPTQHPQHPDQTEDPR